MRTSCSFSTEPDQIPLIFSKAMISTGALTQAKTTDNNEINGNSWCYTCQNVLCKFMYSFTEINNVHW